MSKRLSSLLVEDGRVSSQRITDAIERQAINGGCLDTSLLDLKAIDEDLLIQYLKRAAQLPALPHGLHGSERPLPEVLEVFTKSVAEQYRAVPTRLLIGGVLQVLVTIEVDVAELDALAHVVKQRIEPWIVFEFRFQEALDVVYGTGIAGRFSRLIKRSNQTHDGKGWPAPITVDPIPRFGSLDSLRLIPQPKSPPVEVVQPPVESPPAQVEPTPAQVESTPTPVGEARTQVAVTPVAIAAAPVEAASTDVRDTVKVPAISEVAATVEPTAPSESHEPDAAAPIVRDTVKVPALSSGADMTMDDWLSADDWLSVASSADSKRTPSQKIAIGAPVAAPVAVEAEKSVAIATVPASSSAARKDGTPLTSATPLSSTASPAHSGYAFR